ncbi:MAG: HTH-type transcriptional activator IlvY [Spirochaetales bacterium]
MDFHEIEAFVALARTLHFSRAAQQVGTSPSALSRLLVRLEDELQTRLFERDTRRVELTREGEVFLDFALATLRQRSDLNRSLEAGGGPLRGTLRVYASVTACYSLLPPLAQALRRDHPELRLTVETGDPADAEASLREGGVDLALAALPDTGVAGLECFSIARTPLVFVGDPALFSGPVTRAQLAASPLILPRRGLARERFDRWSHTAGVQPNIAAETAGNEAVLALARLGLGLGLVPRIVLENSPFAEGLHVAEPGESLGDYDLGFLVHSRRLRGLLSSVYPEGRWT